MKHIMSWMFAALVGVSLLFASCVDEIKFGDAFLEKPPTTSDLNQDSIFGKADYARAFLWNTYKDMYYGLPYYWEVNKQKMNTGMFETMSDCWHSHNSWSGVNELYYGGAYTAAKEDTDRGKVRFAYYGYRTWEAIRSSWMFIENVDRVPDMEQAEKNRLKAEAKVIIASRYFDMFRHFGGLPLVDKTYDVQETYEIPRATAEATANFMIGLLDEAINDADFPWSLGTDDANWQGRMTKAAAMALKCKILLFAASPLFNSDQPYCNEAPQDAITNLQAWYGGYNGDWWNRLYEACKSFFDALNANGVYELMQASGTKVSDYRNAFYKAYFERQNNTELLISTRVRTRWTGGTWDYWWFKGNDYAFPDNGGYTPTYEYMAMFPMSDGTPFDATNLLKDGANPFFENNDYNKPVRDPRLYETMWVNGDSYGDHAAEFWIGGRDNQTSTSTGTGSVATGFSLAKFFKLGSISCYPQWPYLRLAEVYLIYAEALLYHGDLAGAIQQVDKVRARVGLGGLAECNPTKNLTTDKDALLEEILRERACELGLEDVRFFDLIRYKRADLFQAKLHGLKIYRNDGGGDKPWSGTQGNGPDGSGEFMNKPTEFKYEVFEITNERRIWWTNFSPKWYLSAFPPSEVNKGYGLNQNPGWN